jgi:class 3 adenylate cyclase/predicted ATPase
MICPACGFNCPNELKYCGMCGHRLAQPCPACGFLNPKEYRFCGNCGVRVEGAAEEVPFPLPSNGITQPRGDLDRRMESPMEKAQLEGERRVVTVIVADVTGSTNLLENLGNEAWVEMMNRVLLAMEAEIYRFGGSVDQFRGDGLVAFFGSVVSSEDDPERAILAALAMQQAIQRFNQELPKGGPESIRVRVGVNTGEVIVASIGDKRQHREDTAMGIAIAVAARLESAAEPGTVLASESTYRQAQEQFNWQTLGEITVKGLTQPMEVFRPVSSRSETDREVRAEVFGFSTPLVGREPELERMRHHVDLLKMGQGSLALVSGEKGIGKQALIREVRQYFLRQEALIADAEGKESPQEETVRWLYGRGRSFNKNWPYSLWVDLLHSWLDVYTGQRQEDISERLHTKCHDLWAVDVDQYYPYLSELLGLTLDEEHRNKVKYLNAESMRLQILNAVQVWLDTLARQKPLVVAFSEVEWADPSSLQLVKNCISLTEKAPILFMLLYREDLTGLLAEELTAIRSLVPGLSEEIYLGPLSYDQCGQLINFVIGEDVFPEETLNLLINNSEGNPSYIVEILRSLVDKSILIRNCKEGNWCLSRPVTAPDLQGNLTRLLQARIDRLQPEDRQVLQMASVIGQVFWSNVLQSLVGDQILVKEPLESLLKAQLIDHRVRNPEMGWEYGFRTDLIHDVVYESLLSIQREQYHLRVAQTLEEISPTDSGTQYQALIAFHYRRAREPRKELFYTNWAAEKAHEVYAIEEAINQYTRALELLDELEARTTDQTQLRVLYTQRFEVLSGRLEEKFQTGGVGAAVADARALLELARKMEDEPTWLIDALLKQPEVTVIDTREHAEAGLLMADQALSSARQLGDRHRELFSLIAKAHLIHIHRGDQALDLANKALDLARELGDAETQVMLLLGVAQGFGMENLQRYTEYLQEATRLAENIPNKRIQLELLATMELDFERKGDYYRLLTDFVNKRMAICREIGDRLTEAQLLNTYAQIEGLYLGDYRAALDRVQKAIQMTEKVGGGLYTLLRIAQLQAHMGRFVDAEETLSQIAPLSETGAFDIGLAGLWLVSAILYNERGQPEDLMKVLEETAKVIHITEERKISAQYLMAACCEASAAYYSLAELAVDDSAHAEYLRMSLEESSRAVATFGEYGFVQVIECATEEVFYRHSRALAKNGHEEESSLYLKKAYDEMMRKYDLIPSDSHFRRSFLENIKIHRQIQADYRK